MCRELSSCCYPLDSVFCLGVRNVKVDGALVFLRFHYDVDDGTCGLLQVPSCRG